jgi:hypothetical protein
VLYYGDGDSYLASPKTLCHYHEPSGKKGGIVQLGKKHTTDGDIDKPKQNSHCLVTAFIFDLNQEYINQHFYCKTLFMTVFTAVSK